MHTCFCFWFFGFYISYNYIIFGAILFGKDGDELEKLQDELMDVTADLKTARDAVSVLMNKRKEAEKAIAAFKKEAKAKKEQMKDEEDDKPSKTEIRNEFVDISIKMPDLTFIKCRVLLKMTVSQLKVRVLTEFAGVKKENLILRFGEDVGENRRSLKFYGVNATSRVYASIRGQGGGKRAKAVSCFFITLCFVSFMC